MKICYDNNKIKKMLENGDKLTKRFGQDISDLIFLRVQYLRNADNLDVVSSDRPYRRHKLAGNYKNHFAVDVTRGLRIIFRPVDKEEIELKKIKEIYIVSIEDYHD